MFVNNITQNPILLTSFEGYRIKIPIGTSWIWDKAGEHLLSNIYPPLPKNQPTRDRFNNPIPPTNGIQPLQAGMEKQWEKEGKKLAEVSRFQLNHALLTRKALIVKAKKYGVDNDKITEWLADDSIDPSVISEVINALPIPEEVRFPKELLKGEESELSENTTNDKQE